MKVEKLPMGGGKMTYELVDSGIFNLDGQKEFCLHPKSKNDSDDEECGSDNFVQQNCDQLILHHHPI